MKKLGSGVVALGKDVQLPPAFVAERKGSENVQELHADFEKFEAYLHNPVVRQRDMRLIAGRDRLIAADGPCLVDFVDCTDEEAEELELVENVHRRADPEEREAQRRALMDMYERRREIEAEEKDEDPKPGRKKSPKALAREDVAKKLGVTPQAVQRMEQRSEPSWGLDEEEPEELGPCIAGFGLDVPETVNARAFRVCQAVDEGDRLLLALARLVNGLEETGLSSHDAQKVKEEYQRFSHAFRGMRPQSVCPRCKARIDVSDCLTCMGVGFATRTEMGKDIPPQLLQEGDKAMIQDKRGAFRLLVAAAATAKPARERKVIVQDANGNETVVDPETGLPF